MVGVGLVTFSFRFRYVRVRFLVWLRRAHCLFPCVLGVCLMCSWCVFDVFRLCVHCAFDAFVLCSYCCCYAFVVVLLWYVSVRFHVIVAFFVFSCCVVVLVLC